MKKEKLRLVGILAAAVGLGGCASVRNSDFYPRDYNDKPVFEYAGEMWQKTGEEFSEGKVHRAIPRTLGAVLATVNDAIELPVRGVTHNLAKIPYAGIPFSGIDFLLKDTLGATHGSNDMNMSLAGGLGGYILDEEKEWYERAPLVSFLTRSYIEAGEKYTNSLAVGANGTYKTLVKTLSLALPFAGGGGGGGGVGEAGPGLIPPGPGPIPPSP